MTEILTLNVIDRQGMKHCLEALEGWRVMEIIRDYGFPIKAECGGACSCATCHIYVDRNWQDKLCPPTEEEEDCLDEAFDVQETSRLSCQILMSEALNGLTVHLAPQTE